MLRPSGIVSIVALSALILAIPLLVASDAQAGSALLPPTKTTGISLNATIVIDVTQTVDPTGAHVNDQDTGLTSITVQKASAVTAAIFSSDYIRSANWTAACGRPANPPDPALDVFTTTAIRLTGLIDTFVGIEDVLTTLFSQFGTPHRAAIVGQNYITCTTITSTQPGVIDRHILSFSAVIQFCVPPSVNGKFCL